jgi:flagellar biosynthesis/type III secretory pathway protein FliH
VKKETKIEMVKKVKKTPKLSRAEEIVKVAMLGFRTGFQEGLKKGIEQGYEQGVADEKARHE